MTLLAWPLRLIASLVWYLSAFVRSNISVTWDILTPTHLSSPHVVAYDTRCRTEFEVSLLSMLITLTPGTMVLATEELREATASTKYRLYVHSMFDDGPASVRESTAEMEHYMFAAARPLTGAPAPSEEGAAS